MSQQSNVGKVSNLPGHLPHSRSEGDIPLALYASTLVQEPNVVDLPTQSDIIIAVMGPTGAGKSTFINKAAGTEETQVGHGLESCTRKVQIVRCLDTQQNRRVVFVDTPGFNDSDINKSDFDVLRLIADWLKRTYEQGIRLSGLLFFHRISDNRMAGSPLKYLNMFQNLCGKDALKKVVLVTTMWDQVEEQEGHNHEKDLFDNYWSSMLALGCRASRFHNTTESAWNIVSHFQGARCTVLLQRELVDLGLELPETSAGRTLFSWLIEFIKKLKDAIARIEAKLKQNHHSTNRLLVEQSRRATEAMLREADAQRERYSSSVVHRSSSTSRLSPSATSSGTSLHSRTTPVRATSRPNASAPVTSSPTQCFSPPPSPAEGANQASSGTTSLQGTITALKLVHQIVGLAPAPGLQSLVGVVLNISELINNMYIADEALIDLAKKAGSFMVTLVEQQGSMSSFSDCDAMKSVIEGLMKEMNRVLKVVKKISSQRTPKRLFLSTWDKAAIDDCNKQMTLACGIFGIQIAFISQQAIARIEAKLNMALKMYDPVPPLSSQQTTAQRATTR